ncbi:hypothetical protein BC832DRAFT_611922 [Gaertneriomyces semiglobifer]|nr:hypothetical protein BC832DRAFT_611922 [Gaertneriomyces semiglobifer]
MAAGKKPVEKWEPASAVWAKYQAYVCVLALFDGSVYAFFFQYITPAPLSPTPFPVIYFLPFSYPGLIGLIASVIMAFTETRCCAFSKSMDQAIPYGVKAAAYMALALAIFMQLSLIPAATFLAVTSITYAIAAFQSPPPQEVSLAR